MRCTSDHANESKRRQPAFTIIELMVVMSIIIVLFSILLPTVTRIRETARRAVCASNLQQLAAAVRMYAVDNGDRVPSGVRNGPPGDSYQHLPWISDATHAILLSRVNTQVLSCPNIASSSILGQMDGAIIYCYQREPYGFVIGYNYLGGHTSSTWPLPWQSPQKISDSASLPLFCDFTFMANGLSWAPHSGNGLVYGPTYTDPQKFGSEGGNTALLDGSVNWKPANETQIYSATPASDYRATW